MAIFPVGFKLKINKLLRCDILKQLAFSGLSTKLKRKEMINYKTYFFKNMIIVINLRFIV